jgi:hypothetical protein
MPWTNTITKRYDDKILVEYTTPTGRKFTKIYSVPDNEETYLGQKLSDIEALATTHELIQDYVKVEYTIATGWTLIITQAVMDSDWIDLYADVTTPYQILSKVFSVYASMTSGEFEDWLSSITAMIDIWISSNDSESLTNYFGQEVTV